MKLPAKKILSLGLFLAGSAQAADLVPTQFKAIETDLARSELQLDAPYSFIPTPPAPRTQAPSAAS